LLHKIAEVAAEAKVHKLAAAFYDYETETAWSHHGDRWFHAASTIKVAVLLGVFAAIEDGRLALDSRVQVRNRFHSLVDGETYRISAARDANSEVHAAIGKTMQVKELATHMIVTSSNLATNLLIDLVGLDYSRQALGRLALEGIELCRGVEDEKAFEHGINNRVTANGLVRLFRLLYEGRAFSPDASQKMLEILHRQEYNGGIPAGLPRELVENARIAHKTGEISTIAHDAGLVFLPRRKPYALAILTEWSADTASRSEALARISQVIYEDLVESDRGNR
jgi:beta-lactamase class A